MTITLTPEQIRLLEAAVRAGDPTIRFENPRDCRTYRLIEDARPSQEYTIPEGILRSQDAFFRDLPELLKDESLRGMWVIYHGDERIGIAPKKQTLIEECLRRGLEREQYDVFVIEPQSREPEEMEIVTPSL